MKTLINTSQNLSALWLRAALAFAFLYAGVASFREPANWESFLPVVLTMHFNPDVLIKFFGAYELALAIWLASGWYVRYAATLCVLTLGGIIISNTHIWDITFRDVSLALAAIALAFEPETRKK